MKNSINEILFDENWVLEMYPFMVDYLKLLTNKPTYLIPYCWNNTILQKYISNNKLDLGIDYHKIDRKKINILIYEPNMSIHKTCLVPLLIAEKYYNTYGSTLNKIYVFCGTTAVNENNEEFVSSLNIHKDGMIEVYGRLVMPDTLDIIRKNNDYISVVLSHNIMNNLNFLHLEMFTLDVPIIHNCEPFKANGLYYDDTTTLSAVDMIDNVRKEFFNTSEYRKNKYTILNKYLPGNKDIKLAYNARVESISMIGLKVDSLNDTDPFVNDLVKIATFIKDHANVNSSLFYNGTGITILYGNNDQMEKLMKTLRSLINTKNILNVEVLFCKEMIDVVSLTKCVESFCNDYFNIHLMSISDNIDQLKDTLNIYMATSFTSFEKGLTIVPGMVFTGNDIGKFLSTELSDESNTVKYVYGCDRLSSLSSENKTVHASVRRSFFPNEDDPIDYSRPVPLNDVLLYDKSDSKCLKIIGTMCELRKANSEIVDGSNILECVCELNFGNSNSCVECVPYVYGKYDSKFVGYGLLFKNNRTSEYPFAISYNDDIIHQTTQLVYVSSLDKNIDITFTENKTFTFIGKGQAKKLPSLIKGALI
jgi:hypothetical protein